MDRHGNNFVNDLMPEFASQVQVSTTDECENEMFCGTPLYMSRMIAQSYVAIVLALESVVHVHTVHLQLS